MNSFRTLVISCWVWSIDIEAANLHLVICQFSIEFVILWFVNFILNPRYAQLCMYDFKVKITALDVKSSLVSPTSIIIVSRLIWLAFLQLTLGCRVPSFRGTGGYRTQVHVYQVPAKLLASDPVKEGLLPKRDLTFLAGAELSEADQEIKQVFHFHVSLSYINYVRRAPHFQPLMFTGALYHIILYIYL